MDLGRRDQGRWTEDLKVARYAIGAQNEDPIRARSGM